MRDKREGLLRRLTRGSQPGRRRAKARRFSKENQPKRGRGRPKGVKNYFTRNVREALFNAENRFGETDGARTDLKASSSSCAGRSRRA